jgi:hypothetical protein
MDATDMGKLDFGKGLVALVGLFIGFGAIVGSGITLLIVWAI